MIGKRTFSFCSRSTSIGLPFSSVIRTSRSFAFLLDVNFIVEGYIALALVFKSSIVGAGRICKSKSCASKVSSCLPTTQIAMIPASACGVNVIETCSEFLSPSSEVISNGI
jgi:hypothetical protein